MRLLEQTVRKAAGSKIREGLPALVPVFPYVTASRASHPTGKVAVPEDSAAPVRTGAADVLNTFTVR